MTSLAFFIEKIAVGLYILSAAGILVAAWKLRQARQKLVVAQFKLERELALNKQARVITMGGLLIEFVIGVWAVANMVAPTLREIQLGESGQAALLERFVTSTPAVNPPVNLNPEGPIVAEQDIYATPLPTLTPVGTILPDAEEPVGCPEDSAWLLIPGNGQKIFEATTVIGTASIANFARYRFEIKEAGPDKPFAVMGGDYTQPVINGPLGEIVPWNFIPGEYRFRLTVFDNTSQPRALCEVTIHISEPPTATPSPTPASSS